MNEEIMEKMTRKLWANTKKGTSDQCWVWKGSITECGYGRIRLGTGNNIQKCSPHNLSWEIANRRPVPDGLYVCHTCKNKVCVNPKHLYLGTMSEYRPWRGKRKPLSKRFWNKVNKKESDECWNWTACINTDGYGIIAVNGQADSAHRVSWKIHHGEIPEGMCVCHKCDNPSCVNPNHLFLGTQEDNIKDMCRKGRAVHKLGEDAPNAKLTEKEVIEIRRRYRNGESVSAIAEKYPVGASMVYLIVRHQSWTHI